MSLEQLSLPESASCHPAVLVLGVSGPKSPVLSNARMTAGFLAFGLIESPSFSAIVK